MVIAEIEELKNYFIKDLLPLKIYLFGYFAEGRETEDSDYDFYIVVRDYEKDMIELTAKAYRAIRHKNRRPVDIIVNTERTFEDRKTDVSSVESEVVRKGILLYGI